ncbi:hypothetical protein BpHYR1_016674 [Brachionus plicatilis]|uniref:Uncharacterized protein n=1 Tax=Brachionus plicatilis TaxID=10195 RepID=A0A3M7QM22_BRAPC|nr:hypothetical protein BpHYR1_016674 [Brachionus plicatilis]
MADELDEADEVDDEEDMGVIDSGGVGEHGDVEETEIADNLNFKILEIKKINQSKVSELDGCSPTSMYRLAYLPCSHVSSQSLCWTKHAFTHWYLASVHTFVSESSAAGLIDNRPFEILWSM